MVKLKRKTWINLALIAPLILFLFFFYYYPIATFLKRSVSTDEIAQILPNTTLQLDTWDEGSDTLPSEETFKEFAKDLLKRRQDTAILARRLNSIETGMRTAVRAAARAAKSSLDATAVETASAIVASNPVWGQVETWRMMKRETRLLTPTFLMDAVDFKFGPESVEVKDEIDGNFLPIFGRTLVISFMVTAICLVIGYPVAWWIAMAPPKIGSMMMMLIMIPFWLSILARTAAWIIVLQTNGPVNGFLLWAGAIDEPVQLIFNRFSVVLVMVHVMLPLLVLPLYNSIRAIPKSYFWAASNLGAKPPSAFFHVILPLTVPGMWAGCFMVFVLSIGYYITPALVGGSKDQMISSFIAFYTNRSVNWSLASALSGWLLGIMLVLVIFGQRMVGPSIKRVT